MNKVLNNFCMSPVGDVVAETGGNSGGNSSLLNTPQAGGGSQTGGGNGSSVQGANNGGGGSGNSGTSQAQSGYAATDWRSSLSPEIQEDASIKKFSDVPSLAASYLQLQKLIGKDKIPIPSKESGEDEWRDVYEKLGLPSDPSKYEVKFKEGVSIGKDFTEGFKQNAYKLGVLPKQAQALADWFSDVNLKSEETIAQKRQAYMEKELGALKGEWGQAYDQKLSRAQQVISKFADDEIKGYLDKTGLGNDTRLIRLLAKLGDEMYSEGRIVGDQNTPQMTPKDAQAALDTIYKNMDHPYFLRNHPGHKAALEEVAQLMKYKMG